MILEILGYYIITFNSKQKKVPNFLSPLFCTNFMLVLSLSLLGVFGVGAVFRLPTRAVNVYKAHMTCNADSLMQFFLPFRIYFPLISPPFLHKLHFQVSRTTHVESILGEKY